MDKSNRRNRYHIKIRTIWWYLCTYGYCFEFASCISPEFKLYIIKEYQRLKKDEADRLAIGWDVKRKLSKINYRIHTDAVKELLITPTLSSQEMAYRQLELSKKNQDTIEALKKNLIEDTETNS